MAVSQLAYIGIGVSDMDAWKTFATDILGMQIIERADDGTVYLRMDENHHRIALHPSGEDDVIYIGLQAPIAPRRLMDFVKFETGGLPFELSIGPNTRWDPPFQPARPMSGFKTGSLGFGHVVLRSTDRDESAGLLTKALGFRVSDYINTMVFLHCNPRHHSIAFQPSIKDLPRSRDKKMWHFMLETNTLDDVGTALDLATRAGIPVVSSLGRHSNDQMVSFYMSTPSGFEVEYGWGGRLVDDAVWQVQRHDRGTLWGHKAQLEPAQVSPA